MPRPRVNARWSSAEELRAEVGAGAATAFAKTFGVEWQPPWGAMLRKSYTLAEDRDRKARKHISKISQAINAARRFVDGIGELEELLRSEGRDSPLLELTVWLDEQETTPPKLGKKLGRSFRTYLIMHWYAALKGDANLPDELLVTLRNHEDASDEWHQLPTDHEFALIAVLCGAFSVPIEKEKLKNIIVTNVIDGEATNMGKARGHALGSNRADPLYHPIGLFSPDHLAPRRNEREPLHGASTALPDGWIEVVSPGGVTYILPPETHDVVVGSSEVPAESLEAHDVRVGSIEVRAESLEVPADVGSLEVAKP